MPSPEMQRAQRSPGAQPQDPMARDPRGGIDRMITWSAGVTWAWFGTWLLCAVLAIAGAFAAARRLTARASGPKQILPTPEPTPIIPATPAAV